MLVFACKETPEANSQTLRQINDLEKKLTVQRADFEFQKEYNLSLSDDEYLYFLSLLDSASITKGEHYLLQKRLEEGQVVEVPYQYVYKNDEGQVQNGVLTLPISSTEELDIFIEAVDFAFLETVKIHPTNDAIERQLMLKTIKDGNFKEAKVIIENSRKSKR